MPELALQDLLNWTGGRLLAIGGQPEACFGSVCTDSRTIEPGSLFLALHGQKHRRPSIPGPGAGSWSRRPR